jgi:chloramphenicol O-acetyltransferase type A
MKRYLDIKTWNRKEHFEFFREFDEPVYGIVSEVDCTVAHEKAKRNNTSFYLSYLHKSLIAVNQTKEFRYRIEGDKIAEYQKVHASPTVGRDDGTFGISFFPYHIDFDTFARSATAEISNVKNGEGLNLNRNEQRTDVIHYSSIPWFSFTGLSHPRLLNDPDNVPKITFGKWNLKNGRKVMPVSVYAHHGLIDGYHIGQFLGLFQKLLDE